MADFTVLTVCTANICRSPASATILGISLDRGPTEVVRLVSAGVWAAPDAPACEAATDLVVNGAPSDPDMGGSSTPAPGGAGSDGFGSGGFGSGGFGPGNPDGAVAGFGSAGGQRQTAHHSRRITPEIVQGADLILALDRSHRSALAQTAPATRARTFTLRQAASLAKAVEHTVSRGELPQGAPPLPPRTDPIPRLKWLVDEMDAARGIAPPPTPSMLLPDEDPLDVPDPHVAGFQLHEASFKLIHAACMDIVGAMVTVTEAA